MYEEDMELGHKLPKGSTPKAISEDDSNLGPMHHACNREQLSQPYYDNKPDYTDLGDW